jgi:hypothetical protein
MSRVPSILDVFEDAWGDKPSRVVFSDRALSERDLDRLLAAWRRASPGASTRQPNPSEIWPLISHHTYDGRTLFMPDASVTILPRVLTILLAHDDVQRSRSSSGTPGARPVGLGLAHPCSRAQ